MARTSDQARKRLVSPFGSPVHMRAGQVDKYLKRDRELYDALREADSLGDHDFDPYVEEDYSGRR